MISLESINCLSDGNFKKADLNNVDFDTRVADWAKWRIQHGTLRQTRANFYQKVRLVLEHCKGIVLGDKFNSSNRLDSHLVLGSMTSGESAFAHLIEALLNDIPAPDYRHLSMEALYAIAAFCEANPHIKIDDYLVLDVIIGHAVRINWLDKYPAQAEIYHEKKAQAWTLIYQSSPQKVAVSIVKSLKFLFQN